MDGERVFGVIKKSDHIVTAFAERAAGPGWANAPIQVVVMNADKKLRIEWLQPSEQTREMITLYSISEAVHLEMRAAVTADQVRTIRKKEPRP